ncbi:MAG TPA: sigma factor-like helix-turn-helix DNA-binding protein [Candidatus Saccharimonadales bacterium]|nr:sigma factor-like helix-turn-helix DNA-binding protein [Candidatus Saccharimonadales bacterium]
MAEPTTTTSGTIPSEAYVKDILATIEREREREIVARRFGLFDRKETLEQIGELLGITRERVRQLEKSVVTRLKTTAEQGGLPHLDDVQAKLVEHLSGAGQVARISDVTAVFGGDNDRLEQSRLAFLALLCPELVVVDDDDNFYYSVAVKKVFSEKSLKEAVAKLVDTIKKMGEPKEIDDIAKAAGFEDDKQAEALASTSKNLATLNGRWGLVKWPMVNPKNIRDKIYVILKEQGKHMHFNEIAAAIKDSEFKRKDVTTQAIHNELIKDSRFVLIGRGIYALKEWGYKKGTVADIISEVLREAGEPLHRDEIVKRVLKSRFVKETTILLNLQGKPQFKRVAKATYTLADAE